MNNKGNKNEEMMESSRFIKKLGTMNHSKREKKLKKRSGGIGGRRVGVVDTETYGSP